MARMCFSAAGGLLFATVLLSGCGGDSGDTAAEIGGATTPGATATEETSPGGGTTASTTAPSGDAEAAIADAVQALQTAAQQAGGTLSEMEIDTTRDGAVVWQVDLRQSDGTVVEVIVDAATGDIIDQVSGD